MTRGGFVDLDALESIITTFQRLVALQADRRTGGGGPFDALRTTITRPDGSEHVGLVDIDQRHRYLVDKSLDVILKELGETIGSPCRAHKMRLVTDASLVRPT